VKSITKEPASVQDAAPICFTEAQCTASLSAKRWQIPLKKVAIKNKWREIFYYSGCPKQLIFI
jgi:hypothetical protein